MRHKPPRKPPQRSSRIPTDKGSYPTSEERFRALIEDLHVGVLMLGPHSEIEYANQAALDMCRMSQREVQGKNARELGIIAVREDGTEIPFSMLPGAEAVRTGKPVRNQVLGFRRADSTEIGWTYGSAFSQYSDEGEVRSILVTLVDITDQKKALAALQKANELNREIILSAQEGIIVHDRQLRYVIWNPYMEQMTGLKASEVLGKHPLELFPFMKAEGLYADLENTLSGQIIASRDVPFIVNKTGRHGWSNNNFAPLRDSRGEIIGIVATVRDVTARKKREDDLHELSARLLQLQDEERRRIARDLHDSFAQSLLAANLNLMKLGKAGGALNRQGRQILAETHKIVKGLSREVRSLSYLLHPPALDELGLGPAIEEYASGFSRRSGIETKVEVSPEMGRLPQEIETALFRVVQESLGNIQQHSGSSRAKIQMKRDSSGLTLEVSDEGRGMPDEYLKELPARPTKLGVGVLGMRERMRQLGGGLEITSSRSGTTVKAALPLVARVQGARAHTSGG